MTDIQQKANEILDKGYRWLIADNYEQRMDFFAQELDKLDPSTRESLFQEILKQDSGATHSWLTVDRLNSLVGEGTITDRERQSIFDSFGQAYVDGKVSFEDALSFTNIYGSGAVAGAGMLTPGPEQLNDLIGTLTSNNSPSSTAFIEKFAGDMLTQRLYVDGRPQMPETQAYAGILLNALDQSGGSDAVNAALGRLSPEQRNQLRDDVSQYGMGMQAKHDADGSNVRDPMAILIENTSRHGTPEQVRELVDYVGEHSKGDGLENQYYSYDNKPLDARAEALGELMQTHGDTILKDALVPNPQQTAGSSNEKSTVIGENLAALSNLVRLTGLNPDNSHGAAIMDKLGQFTANDVRVSNRAEGTDVTGDGKIDEADIEAVDLSTTRLAMIGAVMQDAVSSGYVDLRQDQAARDAFVGYLIDLGVSAIPVGGDFAAKAITNKLDGVLGGLSEQAKSAVEDALTAIPKQLLTDGQGQLTDQAKQAIIDALPEDYQYLEGLKNESNSFIQDAILSSSARDGEITTQMDSYKNYIAGAKGE
ncbi:hypothetical protein SAMN04487939_106125 [Lysobacter sp. yr284]|uniref:hypothetical protein n=1 Tax=Lysobacter sp. yr284 TaxID=1761791 RepID=UPI00089B7797|nr:hypothetical protein [Lysobacter sp. yr284]SDY79573.1 hypothetical protein SAMN04487939_106125 [Lysobacter sp. yr284]